MPEVFAGSNTVLMMNGRKHPLAGFLTLSLLGNTFVRMPPGTGNCIHLRFCELGWDLPRWMRLFKHRFGLSGGLLGSGWFALAGTSVSRHCSSDASAGSSVDSTSEAWGLSLSLWSSLGAAVFRLCVGFCFSCTIFSAGSRLRSTCLGQHGRWEDGAVDGVCTLKWGC